MRHVSEERREEENPERVERAEQRNAVASEQRGAISICASRLFNTRLVNYTTPMLELSVGMDKCGVKAPYFAWRDALRLELGASKRMFSLQTSHAAANSRSMRDSALTVCLHPLCRSRLHVGGLNKKPGGFSHDSRGTALI